MAKLLVGIGVGLAVVLAGCGGVAPVSKLNTRIVSNNSASYLTEARGRLAFGELDAEGLVREALGGIRRPTRTPDRPITPQPIRPKPQGDDRIYRALEDGPAPDAPAVGHPAEWLAELDRVVADYPELANQAKLLRATPPGQLETVRLTFAHELELLDERAARAHEKAWRKATPDARLAQFEAKLKVPVVPNTAL